MTDINAFLESLLNPQPRKAQSHEDFMQEMRDQNDKRIRDELDERPLDAMGLQDLRYLESLCDRSNKTPLMIETAARIVKEREDRLTASREGPTFAPKTYVEVVAIDKLHNPATSAPLPIGIRGRVVKMITPENDSQVGLVQVRFPPKPLGYSGREHLNYYVPNTCLKAVDSSL